MLAGFQMFQGHSTNNSSKLIIFTGPSVACVTRCRVCASLG